MTYSYTITVEELGPQWLGFPVETISGDGRRIGGRLVGYSIPPDADATLGIEPHENPVEVRPKTTILVVVHWPFQWRQPITSDATSARPTTAERQRAERSHE
ncbi:hypothetical protein GCM10029978_068090 [Actinoallomurus acanthiterrae]